MRVLMLTSDRTVDRRILQEGESLIDAGHEVILLAGGEDARPEFEWIGRVKVERLRSDLPLTPARHSFYGAAVVLGRALLPRVRWVRLAARAAAGAAYLACKAPAMAVGALANLRPGRLSLLPLEAHIVERARFYEPDAIHVHDLTRLAAGVCAKRALGAPLVYDAHELYPEIHTLTPVQRWHLARLERRLLPHCDRTVTVNPLIAREMARRYGAGAPQVIYNAIDRPEGFDPADRHDRLRRELAIGPDRRVLLYQGWMSPHRGLGALIAAMARVDERIHLVLMGYGEVRKELAALARRRGLQARVHFKDAVPPSELLWWTASADAGVIPYPPIDLNHVYCSPNKLFEFIQAGVPLIVSDLPFLRQVVGREGFGVVAAAAGEEQLAAAVAEMFDDARGGPQRFRPALLARAGDYAWAREAPKLLAIYEALGAPAPRPAGKGKETP